MPEQLVGYCRRCDAKREVLLTVPWQDDQCQVCGSVDVELDRSE